MPTGRVNWKNSMRSAVRPKRMRVKGGGKGVVLSGTATQTAARNIETGYGFEPSSELKVLPPTFRSYTRRLAAGPTGKATR